MEDAELERPGTGPSSPLKETDSKIVQILNRLESRTSLKRALDTAPADPELAWPAGSKTSEKKPADYVKALESLTSQDGMAGDALLRTLKLATSGTLKPPQAVHTLFTIRPRRVGAVSKDFVVRTLARLGQTWAEKGKKSSKAVDFRVQVRFPPRSFPEHAALTSFFPSRPLP